MKTKIVTCLIAALTMTAGWPLFAQQDKKVQKARKKVAEAQKDLKEAKTDSAADYQKFVTDANLNISENKKAIARLKLKEIKDNKVEQESYNKKVMALQVKNDGLEKRIKDSQHTKTNMWERFKLNFERDMGKLGEEIKRI